VRTPPTSFELMGSHQGYVELDRNMFKITLKPFEPIGVKLFFLNRFFLKTSLMVRA
jgi:hypothetical protein